MLFFESNGRPVFKRWPEQFFNQLIAMSDVLVMFGGVFLQLFYFQGKFAVIQRPFPYLHNARMMDIFTWMACELFNPEDSIETPCSVNT